MKNVIVLLMILACVCGISYAGSVDAMPFLRMGVSARVIAMGSAFVGVCDDLAATYYNPGGLAQQTDTKISVMTGLMSTDRSMNWASFGMPVGGNPMAVSLLIAGVSGIPKADLNGLTGDTFASSDMAFVITYAKYFADSFGVGANLKVLKSKLDTGSAFGFGFDAGVKFNPAENISAGIALQDIGTYRKWDTVNNTTENAPNVAKAGIGYYLLDKKLVLAADMAKISDENGSEYNLGAEYTLDGKISFRGGLDNGYISAGFGLNIFNIGFNYALRFDDLEENSNRHFISLDYKFGQPAEKKPQLEEAQKPAPIKQEVKQEVIVKQCSISGKVTNTENDPIKDAVVKLIKDNKEIQVQKTPKKGLFKIKNVSTGNYVMEFSKTGYNTISKPIVVENTGEPVEVNITLEKIKE